MFSPEQKEVMRPILGANYTDDVLSILKNKGIKSRKKEYYKPSFVRNVFNGVYKNDSIESAILEVYDNRLAEKKRLE